MRIATTMDIEDESITMELASGMELTIQELPDGISITLENSTCHHGLIVERECDDVLRVIDADIQQWTSRKL